MYHPWTEIFNPLRLGQGPGEVWQQLGVDPEALCCRLDGTVVANAIAVPYADVDVGRLLPEDQVGPDQLGAVLLELGDEPAFVFAHAPMLPFTHA